MPAKKLKRTSRKSFDVFKGHKEIKYFLAEIVKRGYKHEEIELILGKNFLRVYKEVLK
jgi:membrane dipeptidase